MHDFIRSSRVYVGCCKLRVVLSLRMYNEPNGVVEGSMTSSFLVGLAYQDSLVDPYSLRMSRGSYV